ncbi:MAG TPA: flagellar motor protein MotA [Syntrophaceae bacterium]|jgi:chemotaxis protein MotA|nr:flagellar motor protein MotA [Syntrophaceae bacterium]
MIRMNLLGVGICTIIFIGCFFYGEGGMVFYFNLISFLVVSSGTIGVAFLSYPYERLKNAYKVALNSYKKDIVNSPDQIVNILLDISVRSRSDGVLSLEKVEKTTTITFLKNALGLLVDGYSEDEIRSILHNEMYYFKTRRQHSERVFRTTALVAPAFGVAGSIIGLIGMLYGVGDTGIILKTIPIALTSTLYGIVLSYYVLVPIAENIYSKTQKELFMQSIMTDGIIEIGKEQNLYKLEKRLSSFLTPSAREGKQESLQELRKRYIRMKTEQKEERVEVISSHVQCAR